MNQKKAELSRRELLKSAGALAIGLSLPPAAKAFAETTRKPMDIKEKITVKLYTIGEGGKPVPASKDILKNLYLLDKDYDPIKPMPEVESDGICTFTPPHGRFGFSTHLDIPDFGELWAYADDGGAGFEASRLGKTVNLNDALASSRLKKVERNLISVKAEGCEFSDTVGDRISKARALLKKSRGAEDPASAASLAMESLSHSMWAGEMVALERARRKISKNGPRPGFLFGCNAYGCLRDGLPYTKAFYNIFNFGTLPFYWRHFERQEGKPDYENMDKMVEWCKNGNITSKGHPLVWICNAGIPEWFKYRTFDDLTARLKQRIREVAGRYAGRIDIWDVINEVTNEGNTLAKDFGLNDDQLDEITKMACEETKAANPNATRIVNNVYMFGENALPFNCGKPSGEWTRTVRQFIEDILRKGTEFEAIGMQLYSPHRDMLELDLLLDRFARYKKAIHITEQGISSNTQVDERSIVKFSGGRWHAPWSETIQADWAEQFWTIAYSKPAVTALTWWDFIDKGHFWPFGGFLREDKTPKESYWRLRALIRGWRNPPM